MGNYIYNWSSILEEESDEEELNSISVAGYKFPFYCHNKDTVYIQGFIYVKTVEGIYAIQYVPGESNWVPIHRQDEIGIVFPGNVEYTVDLFLRSAAGSNNAFFYKWYYKTEYNNAEE